MNRNLKSLVEACEQTNTEYKLHHATENILEIQLKNNKSAMFVNWTTPLNQQSISKLVQDKDYFYNFLKDEVKMPRTEPFLNPYLHERYKKHTKNLNITDIILTIEKNFQYPFILKKNRGTWGLNVFKVNSRRELEDGLLTIFDKKSSIYDFVALAQELIEIKYEMRAVFFQKELQFCYKKDTENATFTGNLSPFHQEGAEAKLIDDEVLLNKIRKFTKPIFDKLDLIYTGLDIAIDSKNQMWLIEANSSPGFDNFIKSGHKKIVLEFYKKIINYLQNPT
jgi:glutathione synthase/RimK-type ligase-like ATP-grasp enzyme